MYRETAMFRDLRGAPDASAIRRSQSPDQPGTAEPNPHNPPKTAQIPEILDSLARTAGNAHEGRSGASHSICQFRAVPGAETPHAT
jgi:hypothetical protein